MFNFIKNLFEEEVFQFEPYVVDTTKKPVSPPMRLFRDAYCINDNQTLAWRMYMEQYRLELKIKSDISK